MSKFGLPEPDEAPDASSEQSMSDRLAAFPSKRERHVIDIAAVDAAAATHGFVSRESTTSTGTAAQRNRRRRVMPLEPTRHLAIRLLSSQYDRFVAYADRHQLTYHDAIVQLLDRSSD